MKERFTLAEAFGNVPVALEASRMEGRYGPPKPYGVSGRVAIVDISGPLAKEPTLFDRFFDGVTGYEQIETDIQEALGDSEVWGILLRINSPGGEVSGMFEAMKFIADAKSQKPVWAALDDCAYSAAYLLASAADQIYIPPETGMCGSIGIINEHIDRTKLDEQLGLRFTQVFEGERKADFSPHRPLAEEALAEMRRMVSRLMTKFVSAVALNRSIGAETVRGFESRLFNAEDAIAAGLATQTGYVTAAVSDFERFLANTRAPNKLAAAASAPAISRKEGITRMPTEERADAGQTDLQALRSQIKAEVRSEVIAEVTAEVTTRIRAEVGEIASICDVAGFGSLASGFIAEGKTRAQVIAAITERKASSAGNEEEIGSPLNPEAGATVPVKERYKINAKLPEGVSLASRMREIHGKKGGA